MPQVTSTVDAWGGSWADTWLLHWTYISTGGDAGAGGGGARTGAGRRRYPYLNIIDDAHLLPQYQALQAQQNARERRKARRARAEPEADPNDPDLVRIRQYLAMITGKG
jgi:hypothetical protein